MKLKVKPAAGLQVRDPRTLQHLPAQGCEVDANTYWHRRLASGCVELVTEPAPLLKNEKETKKEKVTKPEESKP